MTSQPLEIGDYIPATLLSPTSDAVWEAYSPSVPPNWKTLLKSRGAKEWGAGDEASFRVFRLVPEKQVVWLTDSNFGFTPISDRMRPRYRAAIRQIRDFCLATGAEPGDPAALLNAFSDVKGLFNRCIRQDQWDWFDVYRGLGKPARVDLSQISPLLTALRHSVQANPSGAQETLRVLERLGRLGFHTMLERLERHIENTYEGLDAGASLKITERTRHNPKRRDIQSIQRTMDKRKLDRANEEHRRTLQILGKVLDDLGCIAEYNLFIDAFTRLKSGPAIFEVKSITDDNELGQAREAIAQLYEYRYRHNYPEASLWLVFSRKPNTEWLLDYLAGDRGINVLWVEEERLSGPSVEQLGQSTRHDSK